MIVIRAQACLLYRLDADGGFISFTLNRISRALPPGQYVNAVITAALGDFHIPPSIVQEQVSDCIFKFVAFHCVKLLYGISHAIPLLNLRK